MIFDSAEIGEALRPFGNSATDAASHHLAGRVPQRVILEIVRQTPKGFLERAYPASH
jgi:hypothetical protein